MRILVVDDEHACAVTLSRMLTRLGHEAVVVMDGEEALEVCDEHDLGAVITDIDMPGMNGVALARLIRERTAALPIAFCTGSDPDGQVARDAAEIGPVLPKATSLDSVRQLVAALGARAA